jgi:hypothetical protein
MKTLLKFLSLLPFLSLLLFVSLLLTGCSTGIPQHNRVVLNDLNTQIALEQIDHYNQLILEKANIVSTITFNFRGRSFSALGITELDGENNSFSVAAISPMGMTLFKLKREKGKLISRYIMPKFGPEDMNKTADMINNDIALVYFNRGVVSKNAPVIEPHGVTVHARVNDQKYRYVFGGTPLKLMQKSMLENNSKIWSVDYYDYRKIGNKEIPFKIFFKNNRYGYSIDIETKEIKNELIQ